MRTPAKYLKTDALARELKAVGAEWSALTREGSGSPGEGLWERMGELGAELSRRDAGGALQTEIPMQSK